MTKPPITQARLKELVEYNQSTGVFKRRMSVRGRWPAGSVMGSVRPDGGLMMRVDGVQYLAHRLAWLYHHNTWPQYEIDHKNGVRSDNRIANLRDIPHKGNMENLGGAQRNNKSSGLIGVHYSRRLDKFRAAICASGKQKTLGWFATAEAAHAAYLLAKQHLHPFSVRLTGNAVQPLESL